MLPAVVSHREGNAEMIDIGIYIQRCVYGDRFNRGARSRFSSRSALGGSLAWPGAGRLEVVALDVRGRWREPSRRCERACPLEQVLLRRTMVRELHAIKTLCNSAQKECAYKALIM